MHGSCGAPASLVRVSRPADERSQARVQQRDESCRMEKWKFFCDSGGAFGERGNDWQRTTPAGSNTLNASRISNGATLLVSPKVNERKCLQRIKREAGRARPE